MPWRNYAGRSCRKTHSLGACSCSAPGMRPRSKSWLMTARGSGLHRSGFPKGVFGGGRPGLGRLEHWRRTKCSSCWPRAIRTRKPRRYGAESLEAKRKKTSTRGLRSRVFSGTLLSMRAEWRYRGRTVTAAEVVFIRQLIAAHPGASRRRLSHNLCESLLRLAPGCAAINCRMKTTSAAVTVRPRYRHSARIESSVPEKTLERKPLVEVFLRFASSDSAPYRRGFRVRIARGQQELHLVRLQCSSRPRPGRPPPKTPFGKPLLCNPEPLAVISQDFDRGRIPGAEHEQAPREWVFLQLLPA